MVRSAHTYQTSYFLSLEYNVSSTSSNETTKGKHRRQKRSFRDFFSVANDTSKDKINSSLRSLRERLSKLHDSASRIVLLVILSSPKNAVPFIVRAILDAFPFEIYFTYNPPPARDQDRWERQSTSDSSLGLSSCGSWSSFWRRTTSGCAAPPPPHGNLFLRSFSRKSAASDKEFNSMSSILELYASETIADRGPFSSQSSVVSHQ